MPIGAQVRRCCWGLFADKQALEGLEIASADRIPAVRSAAVESLGSLGDTRAASSLRARLSDTNARVRLKAINAISLLRDRDSVPVLLHLLQAKEVTIQAASAIALAQIGDRSAVPSLMRLAQTPQQNASFSIRFYAAYALGALGDSRAVPLLIQGLGDHNPYVRVSAAGALGQMHVRAAVPPLIHTLQQDKRVLVRWTAAQALGNLRDGRALPALIKALKDKDEDVREQSAKALGKIGDRAAVPALIATFHDDDEAIPKAAVLPWAGSEIRKLCPLSALFSPIKTLPYARPQPMWSACCKRRAVPAQIRTDNATALSKKRKGTEDPFEITRSILFCPMGRNDRSAARVRGELCRRPLITLAVPACAQDRAGSRPELPSLSQRPRHIKQKSAPPRAMSPSDRADAILADVLDRVYEQTTDIFIMGSIVISSISIVSWYREIRTMSRPMRTAPGCSGVQTVMTRRSRS